MSALPLSPTDTKVRSAVPRYNHHGNGAEDVSALPDPFGRHGFICLNSESSSDGGKKVAFAPELSQQLGA